MKELMKSSFDLIFRVLHINEASKFCVYTRHCCSLYRKLMRTREGGLCIYSPYLDADDLMTLN